MFNWEAAIFPSFTNKQYIIKCSIVCYCRTMKIIIPQFSNKDNIPSWKYCPLHKSSVKLYCPDRRIYGTDDLRNMNPNLRFPFFFNFQNRFKIQTRGFAELMIFEIWIQNSTFLFSSIFRLDLRSNGVFCFSLKVCAPIYSGFLGSPCKWSFFVFHIHPIYLNP